MKSTARFSVDPRLSALLGESYMSSERALRELVDNAWDAEARVVKFTLPDILSEEPVRRRSWHEEPGYPAGLPQYCQPTLQPEGRTHAKFGLENKRTERNRQVLWPDHRGRNGNRDTRSGCEKIDEYWTVCREIEEAEKFDVFIFANALDKLGLSDLAFIAHQAEICLLKPCDWCTL